MGIPVRDDEGALRSFEDFVMPGSPVALDHHPDNAGGHDSNFRVCAREPHDGLERMPSRDDQEFKRRP